MVRRTGFLICAAALLVPAYAALGDGPAASEAGLCTEAGQACAALAPQPKAEAVVIYLDADGQELLRLPLSQLRGEKPGPTPPDAEKAPGTVPN